LVRRSEPKSKRIRLVGDVTHELFSEFDKKLKKAEELKLNVEVLLCSDGGDPTVALAFYDRIQNAQVKVVVKATGLVASAAVLILVAGHYRVATPHSWVMVHEDQVRVSGDVHKAEKIAKHFRRYENQWNKIMAHRTKIAADVWEEYHKKETYFTAEEAKNLGIIDEVVGKITDGANV
jgi:ATP-dependent Clp protease protease subunit